MAIPTDLRDAFRALRRAPAFGTAAILALALGIGASAAMFSIVDAVLIRPLPYGHADRLVVVMHRRANPVAPANFLDWQRQTGDAFDAMGAAEYWTPNLSAGGEREKVFALRVTPEILPMLGVAPAYGRVLGSGETAAREAVMAFSLWQRRFGADPNIVGREITLDGETFTVVGVMPPAFKFAPFWATRAELWAPLRFGAKASSRDGKSLRVFARLRPEVSLTQARERVVAVTSALEQAYPGTNRNVTVTPLVEMVVGDVRPTLAVLAGAVGLVLLLACINVAHMLLARSAGRVKEVAVRSALGAGRGRLIRQFVAEHLLLALAAGAVGLGLAWGGVRIMVTMAGRSVPRSDAAAVDLRAVLFATTLAAAIGVIVGLVPALRASRADLVTGLRDVDRGATTGRTGRRWRAALIVSEVAFAAVLLAGAGLMIRSVVALRAIDPGFVPDRILSMVVSVAGSAEAAPGRRVEFYDEMLSRVRALPGIEAASAINHLPLAGDLWGFPFVVDGRPVPARGDEPTAAYRVVMPGYFDTMGLPIVRGRDVSAADTATSPGVVIVNEFLARKFWPGEEAIGKRMRVGGTSGDAWQTVIGVSRDAVRGDWSAPPEEEVYLPLLQSPTLRDQQGPQAAYVTLVVRTHADPLTGVAAIRGVIRTIAPDVTVSETLALRDVVAQATSGARFTLVLLGVFAGVAMILASLGIYGIMSYDVASRRHEIGVRLALGATPRDVLVRVIGQGLGVVVVGLGVGMVTAIALAGVMTGVVYGVSVTDRLTFAVVPAVLVVVALAACSVPAIRASRVDPLEQLK